MKLINFKLTAVIIVIVLLTSIFLFGADKDINNQTFMNYYPAYENLLDEELINQNDSFQFFKWNKSVMFSLNIQYILFSIFSYADILKIKHSNYIDKLSRFCNYSVFIVFFLNKKDGRKEKSVYSYS